MPRFVDDYLAYLLAAASARVSAEFHAEVKRAKLSVPKWRALASLSDGEVLAVGDLARLVLVPQPTLTKLVKRMAREGLVRAADDPADRRRTLVRITPGGRARVRGLLKAAKTHEAARLASYAPGEVAKLKRLLKDLIGRSDP
ncbi:MAG: MarR family transcriptional regulator [Tagaea sp.]|nr:MarR family transcriptional regulator [Tagaea sp.]